VFVYFHFGDGAVLSVEHVGDFLFHSGVVGFSHFAHPGGEFHLEDESVGVDGEEVVESGLGDA